MSEKTEKNATDNYELKTELPSRGLLYDGIPGEFTLKMITTAEEKFLYGSSGDVFSKVLENCIVSPKGINLDELLPFDELFLLFQLRIHSYGPKYRVSGKCPYCGNIETFDVDLDELPIYYLDETFQEPIEFTLPKCGKKVSIKLLRKKDYESVRRRAKKISKSTGTNFKELEYVMRMAKYIKQIDGEDVDEGQAQAFVEKLVGYDTAYFWDKLDEMIKCGIDNVTEVTCGNCGEDYDLVCRISSEFFRPKFRK